jgi:hypothetical protein
MPRGGARPGAGRPKGKRDGTLRDGLEEVKAALPALIPPKLIVDADEKDAAAQANAIMQHAGQMAQAYRKLMGKENVPPQQTHDEYMRWANLVLRIAALLLPYERPTYRSIEVRTDHGIEKRKTRYIGDPAERLAQIVVGAIIAQPEDVVVPNTAGTPSQASSDAPDAAGTPPSEPVDNGDGVIS